MLFETTQSHELNLSKASISGILSLSILPILLALCLPFIYVLSDIMFIDKLQPELFNEFLSISPYAFIPSIIILLLSTGTSGLVTKHISKFDYIEAENMAGSGVIWSFIAGCLVAGIGFYFLHILNLDSFNISNDLKTYLTPLLIGLPFLFLTLTYLDILRAQGKTMLASLVIIFSVALNIGLNFISNEYSSFQILGVSAVSTISLIITTLILVLTLSSGRTEIRVKAEHLRPRFSDLGSIIAQGSLFFSITASLVIMIIGLYFWINQYQTTGLTNDVFHQSFLISSAICLVLFSPCFALLLSYQTLSIFNSSTFMYQRVKQAHKFTIRLISIYAVLLSAAILIFPTHFLNILMLDPQLHDQVINLCLILTIGLTLFCINATWSTFLQTQNSIFGANLITWLPIIILTGTYYASALLENTFNTSINIEMILYIFIAAQLLTSFFAWVRFAFSFHEINKVVIEKAEKIIPIKVTTSVQPESKAEKIISPEPVNHNPGDDFISSFTSDSEDQLEQLEDVDSIDEFEKAMQSYNQKMEVGNAVEKNELIDDAGPLPLLQPSTQDKQKTPPSDTNKYTSEFVQNPEIKNDSLLNESLDTDDEFIITTNTLKLDDSKSLYENTIDSSPVIETLELSDEFSDFENKLSHQTQPISEESEIDFNNLLEDDSNDGELDFDFEL